MTSTELDTAFDRLTPEGANAFVGWMLQASAYQNAEVTRQMTKFKNAFEAQSWVFRPEPQDSPSATSEG
jgi:hypothetical protein